tara:strand:+ start:380 stop:586 length:207 start_codon:yes stop_codon:yes gene_type:complete
VNTDKTLKLIDWYLETNPTLQDLENEIEYHKIDMSTSDFISFAKTGKYTIKLPIPEYLKVFLKREVKK